MDKNTIVEYVEESPQNTNRAILNQMLDEFADTNGSGSTGADWEQSDPTAKDYVKNRTHYKRLEKIIIAEGFETQVEEHRYTEGGEEYVEISLTNTSIPSDFSLSTKEEVEALKVIINKKPINATVQYYDKDAFRSASWRLENGMTIHYFSSGNAKWHISLRWDADVAVGERFIVDIHTEQTQYVQLDKKYLPSELFEQPDWSCNDPESAAYIKDRTHYDYWGRGKRIYDYDSSYDNIGLPYTFEFTDEEYNKHDSWLGGRGFMYNGCLFNADSNWEQVGEEYDETLDTWKTEYKCQQIQTTNYDDQETLTIKAISYSQYDSETGERKHFVTIDCEYQGYQGIQLYEAELQTKALDKRFLAGFSVTKDWNVNDENDPKYIENRTHYPYLGQGKSLLFEGYDTNNYDDYNYLPYTQIVQSDLTEADCSGYWLGRESGYWINLGSPSSPQSYLVDAYSDWEKISEEENNIIIYKYKIEFDWYSCILTVAVQPIADSSNEYNVELRNATFSGEKHFEVCAAIKKYKTLGIEYLPEGLPNNIDWNENDEASRSYIRNRPCYTEPEEIENILSLKTEQAVYSTNSNLFYNGQPLVITINGITEEVTPTYHGSTDFGVFSALYTAEVSTCSIYASYYWESDANQYFSKLTINTDVVKAPYTVTIKRKHVEVVHQLDSKYIPNDIPRLDEVVTSVCKKQGEVDLVWADIGERVVPEQEVLAKQAYNSSSWERGPKLKKDVMYNVEITDSEYGGTYPVVWTKTETSYSSQEFVLTNGLILSVQQYSYNTYADFKFSFTKSNGETSIEARIYEPSWIDYKLLNENCIPESIARTSQIEALDWEKLGEYYQPSVVLVGFKPDWSDEYFGKELMSLPTTIKGLEGTSLQDGDIVTVNLNMFGGSGTDWPEIDGTYTVTVTNNEISISDYDVTIDITYNPEDNTYYIRERNGVELPEGGSIKIIREEIHEFYPLKDEYIPSTIARAPKAVLEDVTEAPTAEQYNALLAILRQAGILAT